MFPGSPSQTPQPNPFAGTTVPAPAERTQEPHPYDYEDDSGYAHYDRQTSPPARAPQPDTSVYALAQNVAYATELYHRHGPFQGLAVDTYDGRTPGTLNAWLQSMEFIWIAWQGQPPTPGAQIYQTAIRGLKDNAAQWFRDNHSLLVSSWDVFKKEIQERYGLYNNSDTHYQALQNWATAGKHANYTTYIKMFNELLSRVTPGLPDYKGRQVVLDFKRGLPSAAQSIAAAYDV